MFLWLKKIKAWFLPVQDTTEPEIALSELTPQTASQIRSALQKLPSPSVYRDAVQKALTEAIALWQENPAEASNCLVVLGSPVEAMEPIFRDTLDALKDQNLIPVRHLSLQPPHGYAKIPTQLANCLTEDASISKDCRELVVIPSLAECFLRCIGGLAGIEYLRDTLLQERSRFWLIGCNYWAWEYLDYVCQLKVFFEPTLSLPALTQSQLQEWLNSENIPFIKTLSIPFPLGIGNELLKEQAAESEQQYFQKLSNISLGVGSVAAELWLRSLRYQSTDDTSGQLLQRLPALPDLPTLTASDRYLLYSLLLHEQIDLPALALSLGEAESTIQPQVQQLRRSELILQHQQWFRVNPLYYSRLKVELERNNFLIGEGS